MVGKMSSEIGILTLEQKINVILSKIERRKKRDETVRDKKRIKDNEKEEDKLPSDSGN